MKALQSKFRCACGDLSYCVALAADDVSLRIGVSPHLIMSSCGKRVLDDKSCIAEQFHRVEDGGSADLELAMLLHELHDARERVVLASYP